MYLAYFFLTFFLSLLLTPLVSAIMIRFSIIDRPNSEKRKIHKKKIPLGGGLAVFLSFFVVIFLLYFFDFDFFVNLDFLHVLGFFFGGAVLMIGGIWDDKKNLSPIQQLIAPAVASLSVVFFGVGLEVISNPFGGVFLLTDYLWLANILVFIWLFGMMFTTKLLDGLDGLVSGIVFIGAMMIGFLSLQVEWFQPDLASLAFLFAGAVLGFLIWNWHPAKIFLGEGGSLFLGFMLGGLAILSGSKIATTLLVMAIPILDILRVIIFRIKNKKPVFAGDSEHLHFRLLQSGLNQRQAVLLFYAISFLFGISTLFLQSSQKLLALVFAFVLMMLLGVWLSKKK